MAPNRERPRTFLGRLDAHLVGPLDDAQVAEVEEVIRPCGAKCEVCVRVTGLDGALQERERGGQLAGAPLSTIWRRHPVQASSAGGKRRREEERIGTHRR